MTKKSEKKTNVLSMARWRLRRLSKLNEEEKQQMALRLFSRGELIRLGVIPPDNTMLVCGSQIYNVESHLRIKLESEMLALESRMG